MGVKELQKNTPKKNQNPTPEGGGEEKKPQL